MSEPPSTPDSPPATPAAGAPADEAPAAVPPYLLVMPDVAGASPGLVWPGREGEPAWAIPVQVPPGTRGYALFLPLVSPGDAAPDAPWFLVPAPGVPTQATAPAVEVTTAAPAVEVSGAAAPATTIPTVTAPGTATGTEPATAAPTSAGPAAATPTDAKPAAATATGTEPATAAPTVAGPAAAPATSRAAGQPGPVGQPAGPPAMHHWDTAPPGGFWVPRPPGASFLATRWPGPKEASGRAVPLGVLAGALGTAFFVPLSSVGIGWFLGWLTLTLGVLAGVRRHTAELPHAERLIRGGWAVAALALLAVLAFRNAWWLVTFCVLGALGCATLAIIGGRLVRSILFGLVAAPFAAFRGLPWVRRHISASPEARLVRRVGWSVVATVLVLVVFGALLASADAAFNEVLSAIVPEISISAVFRWIFLAVVGGLIAVAAVYTLAAPPDLSTVDRPTGRRLGPLEWAPAIGALTLLFAGFVVVQFTVLFGGERHVRKVAGLSYSEYARSGFWQLLFVTLLTLAVLGGVSRWASRERPVERTLLRVLLGLLSALSVVIVVSALSRMWTYQKVYSFTGERIFVMAFELMLGAVFLMILAAGVRWQGRWIPGSTVALAVLMLLGLAVLNPEDYAARRNILRYEQTGKIDAWYLRALSADATPALTRLPDPVRRCTLSWIADDLDGSDPWYAWNLGRYRARQALDRVGPGAVGGPKDCRRADQFDLPKSRGPR